MSRALDEYQKITLFKPNPMQEELFNLVTEKNPALLLKSPTGSGKTEAVPRSKPHRKTSLISYLSFSEPRRRPNWTV